MPDIPENPYEWQYANVPRAFPSRGIRQFLIVDIPLVFMFGFVLAVGSYFINRNTNWLRGAVCVLFLLIAVYLLFDNGKIFLNELFRPSSKNKASSVILRRVSGIGGRFASSRFVLINKADPQSLDPWFKWLGGPAYLIVYDGFAAYLEYGNHFRRVVGPGVPIPILDTRETIKTVVDLRPQIREFEATAWTKDGIKVILGIRIEARIGSNYPPDSVDAKLLYLFDPVSVRNAVEYTAAWNLEHGDELSEADWIDVVIENIKVLFTRHISRRRLDELYIAGKGTEQILSEPVLRQMSDEAYQELRDYGILLRNIQITKTQIPEAVYGQRLDVWKAGKDSIVTRVLGQANAFVIRADEAARAQAQRDLIIAIARSLGNIDPDQRTDAALLSLSKILDQGLKDPFVRGLISRETLLLLENLEPT